MPESEPRNNRISIDPNVCHGAPVIAGTRVPVSVLLAAIADGDEIAQVGEDYGVPEADVRAAIGFANELLQGERHYPLRAKAS